MDDIIVKVYSKKTKDIFDYILLDDKYIEVYENGLLKYTYNREIEELD